MIFRIAYFILSYSEWCSLVDTNDEFSSFIAWGNFLIKLDYFPKEESLVVIFSVVASIHDNIILKTTNISIS
jgi:hypothetical protein